MSNDKISQCEWNAVDSTRLTNAFSKKLANLKASVALHYAHYNFARVHRPLRCTRAMAAGVTDQLWSVAELIGHVIAE